jgi:hypothetical protein
MTTPLASDDLPRFADSTGECRLPQLHRRRTQPMRTRLDHRAWDSKAATGSRLPQVRQAIAKGRPLIAGFSDGVTTTPVGGSGLASPKAR